MRFGLTGITSGIGIRLAEVLASEGHEVAGLVRDPSRADARALAAGGARLVHGSLDDHASLDEIARGADVFVHLAAHVGDTGGAERFVRVNVGGTRGAILAAAKARVRRFVHISSSVVYGHHERGRIEETWPTARAGRPYDDTKTDADRLAFRLGRDVGLEVVAIRPPGIYGPHDRNFLPRAIAALRKRQFVFIAGGVAPFNLAWVDHVVDVVVRASTREGIAGEAFNVVDTIDGMPPTVREVAETIADAIGAPRPAISLPHPIALGIAHAVEKGFALARVENVPPFTPFVVAHLTSHAVLDASKAVRLLGYAPRKRSLEGVREEAAAFAARMK